MKQRIIPYILVFCVLLALSASAFAFSFDFSQYSDVELIELETALQKEKLDRGLAQSANVPSGTYTIGVDIPAGDYSIEMGKNQIIGMIDVTSSYGMGNTYALSNDNPAIGKITLYDGDIFETFTEIVMTIYSGGILFN